ncbi:glycerophosphoryl diester phosphodiesterase [Aquabacterium commune]|uniref:glycerophosphodiester phosphodiesterase n=1 Tax=Aquabacterium commune TaxID=70586 RepID=A0A4R6RHF8_9BURK|nr:glycerophosphodiester phosphodiesterase [Aquabacterium commune]TDP85714.1 glycerophosphoryl diester phosphodiesterase [Aquabacterium commune]
MSQPLRKLLALSAALFIAAPGHAADTDRALERAERAERTERQSQALPLVIGHRGASGYLPEHTLESYALAIELGADYVEPDLVATKDGHLIARHEPNIVNTTDVADRPEFASRRRIAVVDGAPEEGFFASDFTLAEIKTLRAKQAFGERPQQFNGQLSIPTLQEVIALVKRKTLEKGRVIGIYPETKHPTYHQALGLPLEGRLLKVLTQAGWNHRHAPVFIQSFEQANLIALSKMTSVRLIQLIDANDVNPDGSLDFTAPFDRPYDWTASGKPELLSRTFGYLTTDAGLKEVASYAHGIGPWKRYIVSTVANPDGTGPGEAKLKLAEPTDLIDRAHAAGLKVHTWTFRNEQRRLAGDYAGNPINEYLQFYKLGIDGVFSDFADTAVVAREMLKLERRMAAQQAD